VNAYSDSKEATLNGIFSYLKVVLCMREMATLDAFFNKIERSVCLSTVEQRNCKRSSDNEKNDTGASRKRARNSDAPTRKRRLQCKRQKSLDLNVNVSNHCASEVDGAPEILSNCQSCSNAEVHCNDSVHIPSSAVEISYEEFLTSTGIAHIETSYSNSEDDDTDTETDIKVSPVKMSLKHSEVDSELSAKSLKKCANLFDEDDCDITSEVASKDIRSFFSKADKTSQPQVSGATLFKIKVDVHSQQPTKSIASSKSEGRYKTGNDLARRQRAAIVITDDDLDIDVIGASSDSEDFPIEFLEDNPVGDMNSVSNTENIMFDSEIENTTLVSSEVSVDVDSSKKSQLKHKSVNVDTVTPVGKIVDSDRKLKLRTCKSAEVDIKVNDCSAVFSEVVNCDHDGTQVHEDKSSDELITVDEVDHENTSATETTAAGLPDETPISAKLRKPKQVSSAV